MHKIACNRAHFKEKTLIFSIICFTLLQHHSFWWCTIFFFLSRCIYRISKGEKHSEERRKENVDDKQKNGEKCLYFVALMPVYIMVCKSTQRTHTLSICQQLLRRNGVGAIKIHNTYRTFLIEINQMLQPIMPSAWRRWRQLPAQQSKNAMCKKSSAATAAYRAALSTKVTG